MTLLGEATKQFWEKAKNLAEYQHQTRASFKENSIVIEPDERSSKLGLFQVMGSDYSLRADLRPFAIELGNQPINATIIGKLTHYDIQRILKAAETEQTIGKFSYEIPLDSVRLTGLPKSVARNFDDLIINGRKGRIQIQNMMISNPTYLDFTESIEKEDVKKLPYVKELEEKPGVVRAILERKPSFSEVEQAAADLLSGDSTVSMTLANLKETQIREIPPNPFDNSLKEVTADIGPYSIKPAKRGNTSVSIKPPFEKTVEPLEFAFEERLSYDKTLF